MTRADFFKMAGAGIALGGFARTAQAGDLLPEAQFRRIALEPKTKADHVALGKHYRALLAEHNSEAKFYEQVGANYAKGVAQLSGGQARDMARAVKHVAEHSRDFAEAIEHLAETHEGYAESMK